MSELTAETMPRPWEPVPLHAYLTGDHEPVRPTVGARSDGARLLYRGKVHSLAAEPEAGKTWLALTLAATELAAGCAVVYLDFEDSPEEIVARLLALQVRPNVVADRFVYVRPSGAYDLVARNDLATAVRAAAPSLVVVDGITEAMSVLELDPLSNKDAATFSRLLARPLAGVGAAVLLLDHVTKHDDGTSRHAIGAQHKLAGLDGAAFRLEQRTPFVIGGTGKSTLLVTKDRVGQLRALGRSTRERMSYLGDLVLVSHDAGFVEADVEPPTEAPSTRKPTVYMDRVRDALGESTRPLTKAELVERVTGKEREIRAAIGALEVEGELHIDDGPRGARLHSLAPREAS